jgi:hypothetical protein
MSNVKAPMSCPAVISAEPIGMSKFSLPPVTLVKLLVSYAIFRRPAVTASAFSVAVYDPFVMVPEKGL